jgi:4-hydroxybenzoate polyprenyltransferase
MAAPLRAFRLVHPFPSFLNAALVLALAWLAGGAPLTVSALALAMLGIQFCIGTVNDLVDEPVDAVAKPWKPVPSGLVSRRIAATIALASGGGGLLLSASVGPVPMLLAAAMLSCGLAYDFYLKPTRWAWACFAIAFPLLPVFAWYGATGTLPPGSEFLLPLAALAGPLLQLANGLTDLEIDKEAGLDTLAAALGRDRSLIAMAGMVVVIHGLAWLTIVRIGPPLALAMAVAAGALAVVGLWLSASDSRDRREIGWSAQAASIAALAVGWVGAAA